jgi:hypothetical protein
MGDLARKGAPGDFSSIFIEAPPKITDPILTGR